MRFLEPWCMPCLESGTHSLVHKMPDCRCSRQPWAMGTSTHSDHCRFRGGGRHPDRERDSPRPSLSLQKVFSCLSQDPLPHRRTDQPCRVEQTSSSGQLRSFCTRSCCGRASRSRSTPSVSLTCHLCPCLCPSCRLRPCGVVDRFLARQIVRRQAC